MKSVFYLIVGVLLILLVCSVNTTMAEGLPGAHVASPDVYKVVVEDDDIRLVRATWQPGQKDVWHSHPKMAVYFVEDCPKIRLHFSEDKTKDVSLKAGKFKINKPVKSHALENFGDSACELIYVEIK